MSRQEDFFNEATKQIRDSYVFQNDETYSDDDVRDIAVSLAEYSYNYTVDKACKLIEKLCDSHNIVSIKDGKYKSRSWLEEQFRKAIEE